MQVRSVYIFSFFLFFLFPFYTVAQVSFSTISDKQAIGLTDLLQVQFIAENAQQIESFQAPGFKDFTVLQGPIETNGMSLVNGEISRYQALTFILRPNRKGTLTIQGATALINGKKIKSNQLRIDVGDAKSKPANPYPIDPGVSAYRRQIQEDYILQPDESPQEKIKKGLLVVLDLDKTTAYVGEPIVSTYKLLTRLRSDSRISKRPSMNGFSVYDMIEPDGEGPTIEERDGKEFQAHIIRKTQLFPLQEGSFELEPVELENNVRFLRTDQTAGSSNRSSLQRLMDDLMGDQTGSWEEHKITLASQPKTITILPLPEGAPASFSGAVGRFTINGKSSVASVAAGETFTYTLEIEGSGNLPLINAPSWTLPSMFTVYDPTITEELNKAVSPMEGKKIITYTISPTEEGRFTIPGISFSYFDPQKKSYHSLFTDSITLTVTPALNRKQETTAKPIATKPVLNKETLLIIGVGFLVFASMIWLILARKKSSKTNRVIPEPTTVTVRPEPEKTVDYLAPARHAFENNDTASMYKKLEEGIWQLLGQKLNLTASNWQKETVLPLLEKRGLSMEDRQILSSIWKRCEWALYAPSLTSGDGAAILAEADRLVKKIQEL
ncbi:BatD family protein [Flavihumibacter sp. UBA7668]|uniref:BatD family protein n=1 Tax=Flavihumibacter sp. UBA7668 TaxID=1946542 RepID=UPI0025C6EBF8|nr:BatD family protein [Flavihumibacter sp. UBA7668]